MLAFAAGNRNLGLLVAATAACCRIPRGFT